MKSDAIDIEKLTLGILGERAFSPFDSKKLVDWAVNALALGYESENLVIRNIVSASGYDARYMAFYEIDEDLDCLRYNDSVLFNSELTLENQKEYKQNIS